MGLVIMRNYSIKLGGEATRGSVFALALTEWGSAYRVGVALTHYSGPRSRLCASLRKRKGFRFSTGERLPSGRALTEWGSISPERVARAAKQALCGVNPFRFKLKMAPWTAE